MGTYPVFLHGERAGVLETLREGLLTRFWASIPGASGLVRLSVYGEDREGYLGVMRPEREGLTLSRAMSRSAMSVFPKAIEYAAPSGDRRREEPAPAAPSAAPAERLGSEEDMLWYSAPDGTLSCFDGARLWIALPAEGARLPGNAEQLKKRIGGREYIVFPR